MPDDPERKTMTEADETDEFFGSMLEGEGWTYEQANFVLDACVMMDDDFHLSEETVVVAKSYLSMLKLLGAECPVLFPTEGDIVLRWVVDGVKHYMRLTGDQHPVTFEAGKVN